MRIVGEIPHPLYRISLLHMNNRYTIKIELDGLEQNYKLRESAELDQLDSIHKAITPTFLESVHHNFQSMQTTRNLLLTIDDSDAPMLEGLF